MKAVILAGGLGTRLAEETDIRPKPMIEIGGMPILWHIMKIYSHHGINEFVICCGYKGFQIKEYFANYLLHNSDMSINLTNNRIEILNNKTEPWHITLVDTGELTQTGGRLKRVKDYLVGESFCLTYGDGVSDINISALIDFHKSHDGIVTLTAVHPDARYGALGINKESQITSFLEKPEGEGGWINGGFMVMDVGVFDFIKNDETSLERDVLGKLANQNSLYAFNHHGFWHSMDTLRDKISLNNMWQSQTAKWRIWS